MGVKETSGRADCSCLQCDGEKHKAPFDFNDFRHNYFYLGF